MARLALPKGRFAAASLSLLRKLGGDGDQDQLQFALPEPCGRAYLLKPCDIPRLIRLGVIDVAVVPDEWRLEEEARFGRTAEVVASVPGWLDVRLSFFAKAGQVWPPRDEGLVATCFPHLALALLAGVPCLPKTLHVTGAVEGLVGSIASFGFDCVETGATLARHGLQECAWPTPPVGMTLLVGKGASPSVNRLTQRVAQALRGD